MEFKSDYAGLLKRCMPCFSYKRDSFWSWILVAIAFLNKLLNIGIMFALGSFFEVWKVEFSQSFDDFVITRDNHSCIDG